MTGHEWALANHHWLLAGVARVRSALTGEAAGQSEPYVASIVDTLAKTFGLSPFERDLLLLCAGMELDPAIPAACAAAHGAAALPYPTFGLALARLSDPHWSALLPTAPLRHWRLIDIDPAAPLTGARLRIDERVLHHLTGLAYVDSRLDGLVFPADAGTDLTESQAALADGIVGIWSTHPLPAPVIQLAGPPTAAKLAVAAAACRSAGLAPYVLPAGAVPAHPVEQEALRRLWAREAVLAQAALIVDTDVGFDIDGDSDTRAVERFVDTLPAVTLVTVRQPVRLTSRAFVRVDVDRLGTGEQRQLWEAVLGPAAAGSAAALDAVTAQFDLPLEQIRAAAGLTAARLEAGATTVERDVLWDACRSQSRARLDGLAQRVETSYGWADLILPGPQLAVLKEITAQVKRRAVVHDAWGFAARGSRGLGVTALFTGPSGTGKTMAAEVLAAELRLDLYRVDLSAVVSKYIGETEKNLRRVFDAADSGGAVLLFDEADALFGKRGEVNDGHDRYANVEVSYLLQRMESYRGLAILATNLKGNLDPAFMRRLRFVVAFPFPDADGRARLWRRAFPPGTPLEGIDSSRLSRLNVTGGSIHTIAVNAAFLAADADQPVGMAHVLRAARGEYAKLAQPMVAADFEETP